MSERMRMSHDEYSEVLEDLREAQSCTHGLTLEGVVETCAECKAVLSHRPSNEPVMREALERIARITRSSAGGRLEIIQFIADEALSPRQDDPR